MQAFDAITDNTLATLPVMEHFYTVQGEGAYSGVAAYFIRLGGCDVGCFWCDVKDSWDASLHPQVKTEHIADMPLAAGAKIAVITGGEPLMHNLDQLTNLLHQRGIRTHIETSGAHPLSGHWDWITFSPKKFKVALPEIYEQAHELKIIVYNKSDLAWAEKYRTLVSPRCQLYLQPEWDKSSQVLPLIIDYVKQHPHWRISLQTHKYMDIP